TWSSAMYTIFGLDSSQPINANSVMAMTCPEDLGPAKARFRQAMTGQAHGEQTLRIVRPDGGVRWVASRLTVETGDDGRVLAMLGTLIDVTPQKIVGSHLTDSEARYRILTENSHDVALQFSITGVIQYVSPSILPLLGYDPVELVGGSGLQMIYPPDLERCRKAFGAALLGDEVARTDYRLVHKDGTPVWVDARPRALRDGITGEIVGVTDVVRDIATRKSAEAALASSEARYRLLADNASDIVTECDLKGRFTYVSPAVASTTGFSAEEVLGRAAIDFVHPVDKARVMLEIAEALRSPEGRQIEHRHITKDGRVIWVQSRPRLARDASGTPVAVTDVMRDITDRKTAEEAISESEARYRLLADNTTDLILKTDKSGVIEYASPGSRLFGYEPKELVSRKRLDFLHPDDIGFAKRMIIDVYNGENVSLRPNREYRFRCKDGRYVWLEGNPTLIRDALGEPVSVVSALRDVSMRRALENSLAESKNLAEAATVAKSEFLANMSHEIRTPLTAIIGFSGLLSVRSDLPEPARKMVQRLKGAGSALLSLVNDILDFSALEASLVTIEPRCVDLVMLAKDALLMLEPQAEAKSLTLGFQADAQMPGEVSVDPDRLRQILLNLIGNAVKFTDSGDVRVKLTYDQAHERAGFRVEDTGSGMDEAQRLRLFQRFSQVDPSSTRRHGGAGLGLAISKGLVEAMEGEIGVESIPGEGSAFYFYIHAPMVGKSSLPCKRLPA
ncbi:MAG: PAS domain S-box protein, partial [Caulobacteraceae bacterium]